MRSNLECRYWYILRGAQRQIYVSSLCINMSLSDKPKAFFRRKMKTRFERMDIDKNGYLSIEDYKAFHRIWEIEWRGRAKDSQSCARHLYYKIGMKDAGTVLDRIT